MAVLQAYLILKHRFDNHSLYRTGTFKSTTLDYDSVTCINQFDCTHRSATSQHIFIFCGAEQIWAQNTVRSPVSCNGIYIFIYTMQLTGIKHCMYLTDGSVLFMLGIDGTVKVAQDVRCIVAFGDHQWEEAQSFHGWHGFGWVMGCGTGCRQHGWHDVDEMTCWV